MSDPRRAKRSRRGARRFVIQQHRASSLHYDFRLEVDGTLRSWAVPKGLSTDPREKRLAVEVEDHPLEYADFEGTIGEGNYGAGAVIVWDAGTYHNLDEQHSMAAAIASGQVKVWLQGQKLTGGWTLQRTRAGRKPQWLLIKRRDERADARRESERTQTGSIKAGRTAAQVARRGQHTGPAVAPPPERAAVMKAVLTTERFSDPDWVFERKLDGIRCVAIRSGADLRLLSRNDLSLNERYPEIAGALAADPCERFAADGEIVAFDGTRTSFARLAQRAQRHVPVFFYVFDLLWLDGHDIRPLPLRTRKRLLRSALRFHGPVRLTRHRNEAGEALYAEACRKGWEGLIAKRAISPYTSARSRDWLKFKCEQGQELVVGGYTEPRGSRAEFGALLLGYHAEGVLRYAGKVGTGFDEATLRELGARLRRLGRSEPPFEDASAIREPTVHWVEPCLVAEVGFTEWTRHGRLRHPRFLGLRDDKLAREVVREQ